MSYELIEDRPKAMKPMNDHPTEDAAHLAHMVKEAAAVSQSKSNDADKAHAIAREAAAAAELAQRSLRAAEAALKAYQRAWSGEDKPAVTTTLGGMQPGEWVQR